MKLKLEHFNGSGKRIARAIGVDAAYKLLEQFGGQKFYVSLNPTADNATSKKLGLEVHKVLSESWPNNVFELPLVTYVDKNLRNDEILQDAKSMSTRELIIKYNISRSALQAIKKQHVSQQDFEEQDHQQLNFELF